MAEQDGALNDLPRLRRAIEYSYDRLEPFRRRRRVAIEQYVGIHYGDVNSREPVPINLVSLAIGAWTRQLVARNPSVRVRTPVRKYKPIAATFEITLNRVIERMNLRGALRAVLQDALMGPMGVIKVGRCISQKVNARGFYYGEPYADAIDFEDWVHDMGASCWSVQQFRGNVYRMTVDEVRSHPLFSRERLEAKADEEEITLPSGDERAIGLVTGGARPEDRVYDTCQLLDVFLPYEGKIVTLLGRIGSTLRVLRVHDYPIPHGPYHQLSFDPVPGNPVPRPPVSEIIDLHSLANALFLKLEEQARRQKVVLGAQAAAKDDAERIIEAADGEVIRMLNPQAVQQYSFGGIDQPTLSFTLLLKDLFSYFGGNIDLLAGLDAQSPTLGQDQILAQGASRRMVDMSDTVHAAVAAICKDIGYWLWTDGDRIDYVEKLILDSPEIFVTERFGPEEREGIDYDNFAFDIVPYSMQAQTPQNKLIALMNALNTLGPFMPSLQQQGRVLNVPALLEFIARETNVPELREMFIEAVAQPDAPEPEEIGRKAPVSHRVYTRINRPDRSSRAAQYAIAQTLLGGRPQQSEAMSAGSV